jgi:hypothetical protein
MAVQVNVTIDFSEAARQLAAFQQELGQELVQSANQSQQAFQRVASEAAQNVQRQTAQITQGVQDATTSATRSAARAGKNMTEEFLRAFDPDKIRAELEAAGLDEQQIDIIINTTQARAETQKLKDSIATALGEASGIAEDSLKQITAQVAREVDRAAGKVKSVTEIVDGVRDLKNEIKNLGTAADGAEDATVKLFDIEKAEQYVTAIGDVKDVIEGVTDSFGGLTEAQSNTLEKTTQLAQAMGGLGSIAGPLGALIGAGLGGAIGYFTSQSTNAIEETRKFRDQMQAARDMSTAYKESLQELAIEILSTGRLTASTLSSTIAAQSKANSKLLESLAANSKTTTEEIKAFTEDAKAQSISNFEAIAKTASSILKSINTDADNLSGLYDEIERDKYAKAVGRAETYAKKIKELQAEAEKAAAGGRGRSAEIIAADLAQIEALYNANLQGILKIELESKQRYEETQESKKEATQSATSAIEKQTKAQEENAKATLAQVKTIFESESIAEDLAKKTKLLGEAFAIEPVLKVPKLDEDFSISIPPLEFVEFVDITKYIEQFESFSEDIQLIFQEKFNEKALEINVALDPESRKKAESDIQEIIKNAQQIEKNRIEAEDYARKLQNERKQKEAEDALAQAEQLLRPLEDVTTTIFDTIVENVANGEKAFAGLGIAIRDSIVNTLKAMGKEYLVKALGETAEGIASLAIGGPIAGASAAAHFKAAAGFAAAAVAAGAGAAAIGSVGGAGGGGGIPTGGAGGGGANAGGGGSASLGGASSSASSQGPAPTVVVDFRGAMFPTTDLRAAQEFGAAVAGYIDAAFRSGATTQRPIFRR